MKHMVLAKGTQDLKNITALPYDQEGAEDSNISWQRTGNYITPSKGTT